jgi:DDE superfamily endonuclease
MPKVPSSLAGLLSLLAPCFTRPTHRTFQALVVGFVSQTQTRTVCGMLVGARLAGRWHHCRAHRFFSRARWSVDRLGLRIADIVVEHLCEPGAPIVLAIDDTLLHRLGRRIHGAHWHHDATANAAGKVSAWGNNWVVVGIVVRLGFLDRPICLPVGFALWRPKRAQIPKAKPDPERPSKPRQARALVDMIAARHPDRTVHAVADAGYASGAWRGLPERVTMTFRLRKDAALYAPTPPKTGRRGRPAKKGDRLPTIAQIAADSAAGWTQTIARRYAKTEPLHVRDLRCQWYEALNDAPCRLILVADPTDPARAQLALLTTDASSTPAQIIERYADRWSIEVCFQDAKHVFGVGEARNRVQAAVERTAPFGFLTMTLTILWYALCGHHPDVVAEHRARAPWYLSKANPSVADMLAKLRRTIIAAQYQPRHAGAPTPQEITAVQQAWAAAAA